MGRGGTWTDIVGRATVCNARSHDPHCGMHVDCKSGSSDTEDAQGENPATGDRRGD